MSNEAAALLKLPMNGVPPALTRLGDAVVFGVHTSNGNPRFAESRDLSCDIGVYLWGSKLRGLWGRVFSM